MPRTEMFAPARQVEGEHGHTPQSGAADVVLVGDNGLVLAPVSAGAAGAGIAGGGTVIPAPAAGAASAFRIAITFDASVADAPAGFTAGVEAAARYLQGLFTDPVTINVTVGYGSVGGTALGTGALGASLTYWASYGYDQVRAALAADAATGTDTRAVASLPGASPVAGATYRVATAEAKALGLMGTGSGPDGYVGFSATLPFDYDLSDGVSAGTYDFFGIALHELTEVMGRSLLAGATIGGKAGNYDVLDLFHYAAPGVRALSGTQAGYFSADGGATRFAWFNTASGGDAGDWASGQGADAFNAFLAAGAVNGLSAADLMAMDAIGWNLSAATGPAGLAVWGKAPGSTAAGLAGNAVIARVGQAGGAPADAYTFALAGPDAASFSLASAGNQGALAAGAAGLAGSVGGRAYRISVAAQDATLGVAPAPVDMAVVVGSSGADAITVASVLGAGPVPAFIHGLAGNDAIDASGMTTSLWLSGGAGADRMSGGAGADTYLYGASGDSTSRAMDVITNFDATADLLDLSGLGVSLAYAGQVTGASRLAPYSVGWQVSNGNTVVLVNMSGGAEKLTATDMKITLLGRVALGGSDFVLG